MFRLRRGIKQKLIRRAELTRTSFRFLQAHGLAPPPERPLPFEGKSRLIIPLILYRKFMICQLFHTLSVMYVLPVA